MTKDNQPMPELLPCPFCPDGGKPYHCVAINGSNNHRAGCCVCHAGFECNFGEHGFFDVLKAWNTRATPTDASGFDFQTLRVTEPDHPPFCLCSDCMKAFIINRHVDYVLTTMAKAKKEGV